MISGGITDLRVLEYRPHFGKFLVSTYLSELIHKFAPTKSLRPSFNNRLQVPFSWTNTYGQLTFRHIGPKDRERIAPQHNCYSILKIYWESNPFCSKFFLCIIIVCIILFIAFSLSYILSLCKAHCVVCKGYIKLSRFISIIDVHTSLWFSLGFHFINLKESA